MNGDNITSLRQFEPLKSLWCHVVIQAIDDVMFGIAARQRESKNEKMYAHARIIKNYHDALVFIFADENFIAICKWLTVSGTHIQWGLARAMIANGLKEELRGIVKRVNKWRMAS